MTASLIHLCRSGWTAYDDVVNAAFLRLYASSLGRPWVKNLTVARSDAIYRLSIGVAAPIVLVLAILIGFLKYLFPNVLSGHTAGYLFVGEFAVVGLSSLFILNRKFDVCSELADRQALTPRPRTLADWAFDIISWVSIIGYVVALYLLL